MRDAGCAACVVIPDDYAQSQPFSHSHAPSHGQVSPQAHAVLAAQPHWFSLQRQVFLVFSISVSLLCAIGAFNWMTQHSRQHYSGR